MTPVIEISAGLEAAATAAAAVLRRPGSVVLVPTETVYGLVCRAGDGVARRRIYELKDRDFAKPLALFAADWRDLASLAVLDGLPSRLAERYCPGPVTVIAPGRDGGTVGFRVPDHPFIARLLGLLDFPLASTSANLSGRPNARSVAAALAELDGEPDLAIDGGEIAGEALASTVVDATGETARIIRQGALRIEGF
ncbi:MAG: L-threonylcarbamoyladenylate synthase [Victivallaceae bacterium]